MQSQATKPYSISLQISLYRKKKKCFWNQYVLHTCSAFSALQMSRITRSIRYIYNTHKVKARKNKDYIEVQLTELINACCFLVNKGFRLNGMNGSEASHGTFLILVPSQHLQSGQMDWVRFLQILGLLSGSVL